MENKKRITLKGVNVPQWYLELEPKLIELMNVIADADEKLKALRTTIHTMMEDNGIDGIESEFTKTSMVKEAAVESILKDKLKEEMPEIYARYVKTTYRKSNIAIKLVSK